MTKRDREAARKVAQAPIPPEPLGEPHVTSPPGALADAAPYLARTERLAEFLHAVGFMPRVRYNVVEVTLSSKASYVDWDQATWNPWGVRIYTVCPPFGVTRDQVVLFSAPGLVSAIVITPVDMETWRTEFETIRQLGALGIEAATWLGMEPIPDWRKP